MPSFLRFSPEDYQAVRTASAALDLSGPLDAFRNSLAEAVRAARPALADRIAGLKRGQLGVLLDHLHAAGSSREEPIEPEGGSNEECELTAREWQAVWRACQLIWVRGNAEQSFPDQLLSAVAETDMVLAAKLASLSEEQLGTLFRQVKGGRRC